jgi:hypothetical protein
MQKSLVAPGAGGGQGERGATGVCAGSARGVAGSARGVASGASSTGAGALVVATTGGERTCATGLALRLP